MVKYFFSFAAFINNTISNDIFHLIMIILEYITCIFPSCYNSGIKLHLYQFNHSYYENSPNMEPINILTYIHWSYPNTNVYFSIFLLTCFFLLVYYAIIYYLEHNISESNKITIS